MHLVVGGAEDVFAADRNVARIFEEAAIAFGLVAAKYSGRNGDLLPGVSDDFLERRSRARSETWIDIFRRREGHLTRKAMGAAVFRTGELARGLIPDHR